jgi:hypothetical protein
MTTKQQPDEAEICRQAGLQAAASKRWTGWTWQDYQLAITRLNHHVSKLEKQQQKEQQQ